MKRKLLRLFSCRCVGAITNLERTPAIALRTPTQSVSEMAIVSPIIIGDVAQNKLRRDAKR
jgi:hypothetical protein